MNQRTRRHTKEKLLPDGLERLKVLINSSTPIVVMETSEEVRAVGLVRTACSDSIWLHSSGGLRTVWCVRGKPALAGAISRGTGSPADCPRFERGGQELTRALMTSRVGSAAGGSIYNSREPCRRWPTWSR